MGDAATCKHEGLYWHPAPANEKGWRCTDCGWQPGEPPGFSPVHDRERTGIKVDCILHLLHESEIIYVSSGSEGDSIVGRVVTMCRRTRLYDSVSIARMILQIDGDRRHGAFWRDISEGIIAGRDPRDRCACGKLATMFHFEDGKRVAACSFEHEGSALALLSRDA